MIGRIRASRLLEGWTGRLAHALTLIVAAHLCTYTILVWNFHSSRAHFSVLGVWMRVNQKPHDLCSNIWNSLEVLDWTQNLDSLIPSLIQKHAPCTAAVIGEALQRNYDHVGAIAVYEYALSHGNGQNDTYYLYEQLFDAYNHLNLTESMEVYGRKSLHENAQPYLMMRLAQWYEVSGDVRMATEHYTTVCEANRSKGAYKEMEAIDRRLLWPQQFPQSFLDELHAFEAILNDPAISDETKGQVHWEMIGRSRAILGCGEELFRREGVFVETVCNSKHDPEFYYATPSLLLHPERPDEDHLILVRLLNYRIDHEGRYYKNYLPREDTSGILRSSSVLYGHPKMPEGCVLQMNDTVYERTPYRFLGTEDPRIFRMHDGEVRVFWTSWEYSKYLGEGSRIVSGTLDTGTCIVNPDYLFDSPLNHFLEKNWVAFQLPGDESLRLVYEWHPLRIGYVSNHSHDGISHLLLDVELPTPLSFRHIRGSSHGVYRKNKLWFLVHGTTWHKGPGPTYYHRMVVLDAKTLAIDTYTHPFRLESADTPVEFSLGITIDASDRLSIAYSVFDGSSVVRRIPMWKLESLMINESK